jgi:hypothetical protein
LRADARPPIPLVLAETGLARELTPHPFVDSRRVEQRHLRADRQGLHRLLADAATTRAA